MFYINSMNMISAIEFEGSVLDACRLAKKKQDEIGSVYGVWVEDESGRKVYTAY